MDPANSGLVPARARIVPFRKTGPRPDRGITPGALDVPAPADTGPVLDWGNYAQHPDPDPDPCKGHSHPPDPHCALASWFLSRTARPGRTLRLVTLTFDPARLYRGADPRLPRTMVGRRAALDALGDWYSTALRSVAPDVDVLAGLEAHKSGARHAHALVAMADTARWRNAWRYWFERYGASQGWKERLRSDQAAAMYAAKYPAKELGVYGVAYGGGRLVVA
jgi:hypothetical protein